MGMEELVDNFYNFLGAGISYIMAMCTIFKVIILAFANVITAFQIIITMQFITIQFKLLINNVRASNIIMGI